MGKAATSLGRTLTMLGSVMGAIAGSAALMLGKRFLFAAADMEEVQGKFDTVFKGMSTEAEAWAKVLNDSYSMSMYAGKKYMSSLQDILVPTGMVRKVAGELSFELVKLGADLSAFGDGTVTQAMAVDNLKSALTGSYEVMKKYGIVLTVNKVNQEAVNLGLAENTKNVSESAKAMAAYSLILQGSTDAMGAHQREQNTFNGLMKEAHKLWKDFSIVLGNYILPYATQFLQIMIQWASDQQNLNKVIVATVSAVQFLYNGMKVLELSAKFLKAAFAKYFNFMIKGLNVIWTPFKKLLEGLTFLGVEGLQPVLDGMKGLTQAAKDFDAASTEALVNTWRETEQTNVKFEQFKQNVLAGKDAMKGLGDSASQEMGKAKEKIDYAAQAQDRFNKMLAQFKSNMQSAGTQTSASMGQAKTSIDNARSSVDSAISAQNSWTTATNNTASAYNAVAKAAAGATSKIKSGSGGSGGSTTSRSRFTVKVPDYLNESEKAAYRQYMKDEMVRMVREANTLSGSIRTGAAGSDFALSNPAFADKPTVIRYADRPAYEFMDTSTPEGLRRYMYANYKEGNYSAIPGDALLDFQGGWTPDSASEETPQVVVNVNQTANKEEIADLIRQIQLNQQRA